MRTSCSCAAPFTVRWRHSKDDTYTDRMFFDHEVTVVYDGESTTAALAAGLVSVGVSRWGSLVETDKVLLALPCFS